MKKIHALIIILNICISIFISKLYLLTNNTLVVNNNWDSEKINLQMGVMGASNFVNKTQPLNRDRLDLSSWSGFQEISTKKILEYNQIEFDALVDDNAYIINHFAMNDNQRFSIKISGTSSDSYCLVIDRDGKFIDKQLIDGLNIKSNEWFHTKINLRENEAFITINDQENVCLIPNSKYSKVGFKGGLNQSLVDNIVIKNNSETVFNEDFSNNKNFILILIVIFIFLSLVHSKISNKSRYILFVTIDISLLLSILTFYIYLLCFFIGNYPNINSYLSSLKSKETEWIDKEIEIISTQIMTATRDNNIEKIMIIGSSQTWGAGASSIEKTFPAILENELNIKIDELSKDATSSGQTFGLSINQDISVVNAGISGTVSFELLDEYQKNWIKLKPKILIINLSSNDFNYGVSQSDFKKNIEEFISLNKLNNIKTILVIEASSSEYRIYNPLHNSLKEISADNNIPIIEMNEYLKDKNDSGLLWWDFIHPTNYGHQLIAKHISDFILDNINYSQEDQH